MMRLFLDFDHGPRNIESFACDGLKNSQSIKLNSLSPGFYVGCESFFRHFPGAVVWIMKIHVTRLKIKLNENCVVEEKKKYLLVAFHLPASGEQLSINDIENHNRLETENPICKWSQRTGRKGRTRLRERVDGCWQVRTLFTLLRERKKTNTKLTLIGFVR